MPIYLGSSLGSSLPTLNLSKADKQTTSTCCSDLVPQPEGRGAGSNLFHGKVCCQIFLRIDFIPTRVNEEETPQKNPFGCNFSSSKKHKTSSRLAKDPWPGVPQATLAFPRTPGPAGHSEGRFFNSRPLVPPSKEFLPAGRQAFEGSHFLP